MPCIRPKHGLRLSPGMVDKLWLRPTECHLLQAAHCGCGAHSQPHDCCVTALQRLQAGTAGQAETARHIGSQLGAPTATVMQLREQTSMAPAMHGLARNCAHNTKVCRMQGRQPLRHGDHWSGDAAYMYKQCLQVVTWQVGSQLGEAARARAIDFTLTSCWNCCMGAA